MTREGIAGLLFPARLGPWTRGLVSLVGLHSCALGAAMLVSPGTTLPLLRFGASASSFFESQSGVFLLILGVCYLAAASRPALVFVLLVSKACAVVFLLAHAAFLGAPPVVWAAAAGDATMLALVVAALRLERREGE